MKTYQKLLAVIALSGICLAAPAPSGEVAAKKSKKHHAVEEQKAPCEACEAIKRLEEKVAAQQAEIDALKGMKPAPAAAPITEDDQARAAAAAAKQAAADAAAAAAAADAKAAAAQSDVAGMKKGVDEATATAQAAEKKAKDLDQPGYIHYKNVKITPGGYAQFASIYRNRNMNSDTNTSWGSVPLDGTAASKLEEWRESGRASRLSLKVEGEAKHLRMMGYFETDFLGTTPNANEVQSSSYSPRLRLAFGSVAFPGGWQIVGGQNWSLLQTTKKGIDPLSEWGPGVVDNAYLPGFAYARLASIRVTKTIGNHAWIGFAVEEPQTVSNIQCLQRAGTGIAASCSIGTAVQGLQNTTVTQNPSSSTFPPAALGAGDPSNNIAPDLVAKLAFEPGWGHYELKAVGRFFRDRVYASTPVGSAANPIGPGVNKLTEGAAFGASAILPVVPKKVDVILQALGGQGIGRYSPSSGPDVTLRTDGSLAPIKGVQAIIGVETHPTPKLDVFVYGGDEYYASTTYSVPDVPGASLFGSKNVPYVIGYGSNLFLDGGCHTEFGSCMSSAQTRNIWSVAPGFWYRMYKGKEGTVQFGVTYTYVDRRTWSGIGATAGSIARPQGTQNQVESAFRYYLP